jgi:effector-binding domain-containing protein
VSQQANLEHVVPRPLVTISTTASADRLGSVIISTLDKIWPVLRGQSVRTGHNVVIYRGVDGESLIIDVGVEVFGDVAVDGELRLISTPSGEVATIAHFGEYSAMQPAYAAIERWCAENQREKAGVSWEVYGDWEDDPAKRRTDIYFGLEPRRRWDDDERFTGVADARDFAAAADELVVQSPLGDGPARAG